MVARNLSIDHRFIVVTDQPGLFSDDDDIHAVPIDWTTHVPGTCFVRLFTFSPQAQKVLGERVLQLDLDTVIVGSFDEIVDRDEDIVIWRNPRKWALTFPEVGHAKALSWFNPSIMLHSPGTWSVIWQNFDAKEPGARDDQWLMSDYFGKDCPYWDQTHGVYRLTPGKPWIGIHSEALPENARIVTFPSSRKPWLADVVSAAPWIEKHRR